MAPPRMPEAVIGLDAGISSHWACIATGDGEIQLSTPVANKEGDLDSPFGRFPDALVVVDQSRNIVRPRARPSQGGRDVGGVPAGTLGAQGSEALRRRRQDRRAGRDGHREDGPGHPRHGHDADPFERQAAPARLLAAVTGGSAVS